MIFKTTEQENLAQKIWRRKFGARKFGARKFGAEKIWRRENLAQRKFGAKFF
jgi:hypothetical protein